MGEILMLLMFNAAFALLQATGNFQLYSLLLVMWQAFAVVSMVRYQAVEVGL